MVLNDLSLVEKSNKLISQNNNAIWAKIIFNRRVFYVQEFSNHYLDNFRPDFLFISGDINPRLSVRWVGEMYWFEIIFAAIGLYCLVKKRDKPALVLLGWLILAPVPAAMARETPHALRILNILPVPTNPCCSGTFSSDFKVAVFNILVWSHLSRSGFILS